MAWNLLHHFFPNSILRLHQLASSWPQQLSLTPRPQSESFLSWCSHPGWYQFASASAQTSTARVPYDLFINDFVDFEKKIGEIFFKCSYFDFPWHQLHACNSVSCTVDYMKLKKKLSFKDAEYNHCILPSCSMFLFK